MATSPGDSANVRRVRPLRLRPDNFTPPTRTPWGGRRIVEAFKAGLAMAPDRAAWDAVGESWEFSIDPTFPSLLEDGRTLVEALPEAASTPMLVKLLDAAADLSVQVHPPDDYPGLASGQSGKPEAWYVLDAAPGAGLWLGLADGVDRPALARALSTHDDLRPMLNFVPVTPGDCFVIAPGTVHAVGAGVTLVEPQLVRPGLTGTTFRFWDWNRRYDAQGHRDPAGTPRPLHETDSLAVTPFDSPRGAAFVASLRRHPTPRDRHRAAVRDHLCVLPPMHVARLSGRGALPLPALGALAALVVVRGQLSFTTAGATVLARAGETLALPAALGPAVLDLDDAEAILTWCQG